MIARVDATESCWPATWKMSVANASSGGSSSSHARGRKFGRASISFASTGSAFRRNSRAVGSAATLIPGFLRVYPRAVAEVEADRLHHLKRHVLGEDVGGSEHARVLLGHGCRRPPRGLVQDGLDRRPGVCAVLLVVRSPIEGVDRLPRALDEIGHVLLVQRDVVARPQPTVVSADEVLPRVGERVRRRLEIPGDVLRQVGLEDRHPARVDDVDQHERVVVGEVDDDVVGRVVRAVPGEVDALAADLERAAITEGLLVRGPRRIVVAQQQARSEEHTSELQSLAYLVCRLLLEKKKKNKMLNLEQKKKKIKRKKK